MGRRKTRMISQESKDRIKESLSSLGGDNLTVEQMETISGLREFIDSEDESEGRLRNGRINIGPWNRITGAPWMKIPG